MEVLVRKVYTGMLMLIWISLGINIALAGPILFDLRLKLDSSSGDIARCVSAQGVGILVGAIVSGLTVDELGQWKFLEITVSALMGPFVVIGMAFVMDLNLLWACFFLLGVCHGVTSVTGQKHLLELWQEKVNVAMHLMHMGLGVGAILAPILTNPFLAEVDFNNITSATNDSSNINNQTNSTTPLIRYRRNDVTTTDDFSDFVNSTPALSSTGSFDGVTVLTDSRLHLALIATGVVMFVLALPFFIYPLFYVRFFKLPKDNGYARLGTSLMPVDQREYNCLRKLNPATYSEGSLKFGIFIFVMIVFYFGTLNGSLAIFGSFLRTFSVDAHHFSRNAASYLGLVFWSAFTISRLLGSLLAHCIDIRILFVVEAILFFGVASFANMLASESKDLLWVCSALVGFSLGPLFPTCVSYLNTQIEIGGAVMCLIVLCSGFGSMTYVWLEGWFYEVYGTRTLLYVIQASSLLLFMLVVITLCVGQKRGDRFTRASQNLLNLHDLAEMRSYTKMK